jgi:dephospho-CoA kinase
VLIVGLTGGIGSGKTAVARLLADRGAVVVDADLIAREVVEPGTPGLARVVDEFGPAVLSGDGALDRAALAAVVFSDSARLAALNAIVHPLVAARTRELIAQAADDAVVVHDVPLLVENDLADDYDIVVVVDVPPEVQIRRLVEERGLTEADARARIAAQAGRAQRLAVADVVIDNSGDLATLARHVDALWGELARPTP